MTPLSQKAMSHPEHLCNLDVCWAEALDHATQLICTLPLVRAQPASNLHQHTHNGE